VFWTFGALKERFSALDLVLTGYGTAFVRRTNGQGYMTLLLQKCKSNVWKIGKSFAAWLGNRCTFSHLFLKNVFRFSNFRKKSPVRCEILLFATATVSIPDETAE